MVTNSRMLSFLAQLQEHILIKTDDLAHGHRLVLLQLKRQKMESFRRGNLYAFSKTFIKSGSVRSYISRKIPNISPDHMTFFGTMLSCAAERLDLAKFKFIMPKKYGLINTYFDNAMKMPSCVSIYDKNNFLVQLEIFNHVIKIRKNELYARFCMFRLADGINHTNFFKDWLIIHSFGQEIILKGFINAQQNRLYTAFPLESDEGKTILRAEELLSLQNATLDS